MSAVKVDVLAVMHGIAELLATDDYEGSAADLLEASAAVAELIEALGEYQSIRDWVRDKSAPVLQEELDAVSVNAGRLRAALAAVSP